MPLVRTWFAKKRDEVQRTKFECKVCKKKFLFENSMKVHIKTRCNKEVIALSGSEVTAYGVCEELETGKSQVEVEGEDCVKVSSESAKKQTYLLVFNENEI